jgi:arginyl-tRNA synthetase
MGIEEDFRSVVERALSALVASGELPASVTGAPFSVERPKRADHGDLATNAAMTLQKLTGKPPRELAALLKARLEADPVVASAEIAGPGFLNVRLVPSAFHSVLAEAGERILLEFVSANPTGPLLISHARGALLGDAVGRILEAAGNHVSREYYVNDFGNQVKLLAASVAAAAYGEPTPEDGYPGDYVVALAGYIKQHYPQLLEAYRADPGSDQALADLSRQCVSRMLDGVPGSPELPGIRATLKTLRVSFDSWYSEESLHRWGRVQAAIDRLRASGHVQQLEGGALVFKMPEGEGEKDAEYDGGGEKKKSAEGGRVVRKEDGKTFTYFASDIAYHAEKVDRGYTRIIDVLGADHHGYTPRIRNVMEALGLPKERFECILFQLVSLLKDGKPYKMGKRLGNLITCDEVVEEIDEALGPGAGTDALRYFYLSRRTENPVELDIDIAKKATIDNPAIYLQYGHARFCSVLKKAHDALGMSVPAFDPALAARLTHPLELSSLQRLGSFPRVVQQAAKDLSPTVIIQFLKEMAEDFNAYWTQTYQAKDFILPPDRMRREQEGWEKTWDFDKTRARLLWVNEMRKVYATGLSLVGIRAPERLERVAQSAEADEDPQEAPPGA